MKRMEETCPECKGKGFRNWMGDEMCQKCNGTGKIIFNPGLTPR